MENRFNLVDEPWIPVADHGRQSLRSIFSDPSCRALGGSPVEKAALLKLLQSIAQAAATPVSEEDWAQTDVETFSERVLAYLDRWKDRFDLYGERPFLQMPEIAPARTVSFGAILPEIATGNATLITHFQVERDLTDAEKAVALVALMGFSFAGKKTDNTVVLTKGYAGKRNDKGKPSSGRPGPSTGHMGFLHNFLLGENLRETLWLNTLSEEAVREERIFPAGVGSPPWECMPSGEDCPVARSLRESLHGRLVPLSRFCLLADTGLHYSEGIAHDGYKDGKFDPSVAINRSGKEFKALWVNPQKRPWREVTALLAFVGGDNAYGFDSIQVRRVLPRVAMRLSSFSIWSGGLRVSSNAGEQYVSGDNDAVESEIRLDSSYIGELWWDRLKSEMESLDGLSRTLYACVAGYFASMSMARKQAAGKRADQATQAFWHQCEQEFPSMVEHSQGGEDHERERSRLRKRLAARVYAIYDRFCPRSTARQQESWAANRPSLSKYIGKEAA